MADYHLPPNIDEIKRFTVGIMRSVDSNLAVGIGVIVKDEPLQHAELFSNEIGKQENKVCGYIRG